VEEVVEPPSIEAELLAAAIEINLDDPEIKAKYQDRCTFVMTKQGGGTSLFGSKSWKERLFLVEGGWIAYFDATDLALAEGLSSRGGEAKVKCLGAFSLDGCVVEDYPKEGPLCVSLVLKERPGGLVIRCKDSVEFREFLLAIKAHIQHPSAALAEFVVEKVVEPPIPFAELDAMSEADVLAALTLAEEEYLIFKRALDLRLTKIEGMPAGDKKETAKYMITDEVADMEMKKAEVAAFKAYLEKRMGVAVEIEVTERVDKIKVVEVESGTVVEEGVEYKQGRTGLGGEVVVEEKVVLEGEAYNKQEVKSFV